jgi:hypothetical protein
VTALAERKVLLIPSRQLKVGRVEIPQFDSFIQGHVFFGGTIYATNAEN